MRAAWQIDGNDITSLQGKSDDFVSLVNALIAVHGRHTNLPDKAIRLNQKDTAADEGVDAAVDQAIVAPESTGRFAVPTCWQYKAQPTSNIKPKKGPPWTQEAALREEIAKPYSTELIKKGYGYRLCIADDMPPKTKAQFERWLTEEAKRIKSDASDAQVLTASDLAQWVNRYPAIVLRLRPEVSSLKPFEEWAAQVRAITKDYIKTSEWRSVSEKVKCHVNFGLRIDTVLVVQGEAGVGKTRTICEALSGDPATEAMVAATSDERAALEFAQAVSRDPSTKAILVADECSLEYRERLRQVIPVCRDRLRVIAIDNSLQRAGMAGEIRLTQMSSDEVDAVLKASFPELPPDRRRSFARLARGFVRLAVDLCQYNHLVPADGSIGSVSALFHDSYLARRLDDHELSSVQLISLLPRVGYRDEVAEELRQICAHPVIAREPQRVIEIAGRLKQSPGFIAFAGRFLYVTPTLIAQAAFQSAWDRWVAPDPARFLGQLSPDLLDRFVDRSRQSQNQELAAAVADFFFEWAAALGPADMATEATAVRLTRLVETQPDVFLPILQDLLDRIPVDDLRQIHTDTLAGQNARRQFVWLAEKLTHLGETFERAEHLLLRLARSESESHLGNSASRIWASLFRIVLSGTPVPFAERLVLLERRLSEADAEQLPLALAAFDETLTDAVAGMLAPPPVILGRIPPPTWRPANNAERIACRRASMDMAASLAARGGPLADALRSVIVERLSTLLIAGSLDQVQAVLEAGPLPDQLLAAVTRELEDFLDTFCREHTVKVQRKQSGQSGPETVSLDEKYPRKVSPEVEVRVREWYNRLVPTTLHGRIVSVVGRDSWQQEVGGDRAAWQQQVDALAGEFLADVTAFDRELPWLASSEARSGFHLGQALGRMDTRGLLLDRVLISGATAGAIGLARGYLDRAGAEQSNHVDRVNAVLDQLESTHPRLLFDLIWSAGASVRKIERTFRMVDAGNIPPELLRSLEYDIHDGRCGRAQLISALERLIAAAEGGNGQTALASVHLLYTWLRRDRNMPGKERLAQDSDLRPMLLRVLRASLGVIGNEPTFWLTLAEDMSDFEPDGVSRLVATALAARNYNTRELAEQFLGKMASTHPRAVMVALGEAFLDEHSGPMLQIGNLFALIRAIPEAEIITWIEAGGVPAARAIARHLPLPYIDASNTPIVPSLTAFVLERFEGEDGVFRAFLSGSHSRQIYEGDISAQYKEEEQVARRFLNHSLRRVREWAKAEAESARHEAKYWQRRDEEDVAP